MCGYAVETVVISGSYSLANFAEDLQRMYRRAGVKAGSGLGRREDRVAAGRGALKVILWSKRAHFTALTGVMRFLGYAHPG